MKGLIFDELIIKHQTPKRIRLTFKSKGEADPEKLQNYIAAFDWAKSARINMAAKSIAIEYEKVSVEPIIQKLYDISFEDIELPSRDSDFKEERLLPLAAPLASLLLTPVAPDFLKLPISLAATYRNMLKGLIHLPQNGINSEVLESLAIAVSLYRKDYFAANTTNFLLELTEHIEDNISRKSDLMLQSLLVPDIKEVWVEKNGEEQKIAFENVSKGDIVIVGAGEVVPIDGTILSGEAYLDESSMSGEAALVSKTRGDMALSGTLVKEGRLRIWAEQVGEQSATYKIASLIRSSLASKSKTQIDASKMADKLVPVTLGLAGFTYLVSRDLARVAAVFQADYSCALKLATPVAFKSSMFQAGKNGALVKGADILEKIASADTVVFDKTGTLSTGKLMVSDIFSLNSEWTKDAILSLAASIEEHYFHPIAEAVVSAAKSCDKCRHFHHSEVEFIVAHGVGAYVDEKKVVIGSRHFLEDDEQIEFCVSGELVENELKNGKTLLYIGYDGKLLGIISMMDELRHNAKSSIEKLRELGVKEIIMLTGDHAIKAKETAEKLALDSYYAELLPEDKLNIVNKLKAENKRVIFVGDGINDAPSLAGSDVGIAMQRGADVARVSADVALLKDDISLICELKELSNKTMAKVSQNYTATIWINSVILAMAGMGALSPVGASLLHNGATVAILANAIKNIKLNT